MYQGLPIDFFLSDLGAITPTRKRVLGLDYCLNTLPYGDPWRIYCLQDATAHQPKSMSKGQYGAKDGVPDNPMICLMICLLSLSFTGGHSFIRCLALQNSTHREWLKEQT